MLNLSQKSVEACTNKYGIFRAIKVWENARAANAFSRNIKQILADENRYFHLEEVDRNNWNLFEMDKDGNNKHLLAKLKRDINYPEKESQAVIGNKLAGLPQKK
jgi:hypothetical protein